MAPEPVWVSAEAVRLVHQLLISEYGGTPGVRDAALLEAAIARPRQLFAYGHPTPGLSRLAAAYGYGIIKNHPFIDGNKRTGLVAMRMCLTCNGRQLVASPADKYTVIMATAAGSVSEEELVGWVEAHVL